MELLPETFTDFRAYLEAEFSDRSQGNRQYSLRAFAKFLDTESSFLSKMLKGQRKVSGNNIVKFSHKLGLNLEQINHFVSLTSAETDISEGYSQIQIDEFNLISDWYHYAILELIQVDDFQADTRWVSRTLGITFGEAHAAIERLKRLGLVKIEGKKWVCTGQNTTVGHHFTLEALRNMQRQILQQAIHALENTSMSERDQSSMTFCVDLERLEEAKKRIQKFRRELSQFLENGDSKDKVYQLSISLFPVSHRQTKGVIGHA